MMRSDKEDLFSIGMTDWEQRAYRSSLKQLRDEYRAALRATPPGESSAGELYSLEFLQHRIRQEMRALEQLRALYARFERTLKATQSDEDRRHLMLNLARDLGATPRQLKKDAAAFARWFDPGALEDRCRRRHLGYEYYLAFLLGRLGALGAKTGRNTGDQGAFWNELQLESLVRPLLAHEGDVRVRLAAFRCLATVLSVLDPAIQEKAVEVGTLQYIYRAALQHQQNVWIQCAALELLVTLSWSSFERALRQRLLNPAAGDDLFYRRRAVGLMVQHFDRLQCGPELIPALLADPSPFVRQLLPKVIVLAPAELGLPAFEHLIVKDASPQARAAAWLEVPGLLTRPAWREHLLRLFREVAPQETNEFVLRVICVVAEKGTSELVRSQEEPVLREWQAAVRQVLLDLRCQAGKAKVRRWASQSLEFVWSECDREARILRERFAAIVRSIPRGRSRRIPAALTEGLDPVFLGRLWSVVCQNDYEVQLQHTRRGYKVIRGHVFGFRWWRWWHEFRHPSPDKRQAFPHTIGRIFDGELHIPSGIMAELAQTKVPGEPLHISEEAGWRPYLPLLDELTSSIELGRTPKPVRIFSSEGVTTVTPPRGMDRWRAAVTLTWRFRDYAEKRNWLDTMQEPPNSYLNSLEKLGFKFHFTSYPDTSGEALPADSMVKRFFSAVLFPTPLVDMWSRFQDYFVSLYQNSTTELAVFALIFALLFFGLHLFFNTRLKFWRNRIPVIVGGWGTRGKSGTERLKAALFNAIGLGVVSKTTGCEAMFLQAHPFGTMKEMFLFRPYDKATIWEQINVVRIAGRLKTDVLLWECMGLTPAYVKILQRSWMRDQISTITNTYPDHEDLQGPAGINIPEVISCFIPQKSSVITSEEQMLPILASEAQRCQSRLQPVTWLEAGMIPTDVLQRFPYEEHPYNIALVLALAEEIGIDRDFALKEMADRVVPDLGVLKTYPAATIRTRRLEFTNGMSANERFGTISNWIRTGFNRQDYLEEPNVWLTTVVNNRADRVPRSQVFARILVNDLSADRHFLIGGNLNGLLGYIREAWSEKAPQISLWRDSAQPEPAQALKVLEQQAIQMRLPFRPELVQHHLRIMLSAQSQLSNLDQLLSHWEQPDALKSALEPFKLGEIETAIIENLQKELTVLREYQSFAEEIRLARPDQAGALDHKFRELLQRWFQTKIVVVENYYASGNEIVELIARHTPPGFLNRVMGIQNIKGTGLDFVYRWQAWQRCYNAAQPLRQDKVVLTRQLIAPLAAFEEYGVLCAEYVRETVARLQSSSSVPQSPEMLEELQHILQRLEAAMDQIQQRLQSTGGKKSSWFSTLLLWLEEFLDAGDAVRRRSKADRIYEDLIAERISRERAVDELQALTLRQKGGWLLKMLQRTG